MKTWILIVALIMALTLPITAKQEILAMGPYKVSFDMGIDDLMNWIVSGPINSESMDGSLTYTKYTATLADLTYSQFVSESRKGHAPSSIFIDITQYNFTQNKTGGDVKKIVEAALYGSTNTAISERTIDGHNGAIGSGTKASTDTMYIADWWMENNTAVSVISFYPWDEGTLSLLKTIHIEKINTTA